MNAHDLPAWLASLIVESPNAESLARKLYFHGTCENIVGPLRPGGYDSLLWFADSPMIAQNYIPATGSKSSYQVPKNQWELEATVTPPRQNSSSIDFSAALVMGHRLTYAAFDQYGRCNSWQWNDGKEPSPTRADVRSYLESQGYDTEAALQDSGMMWVKIGDLLPHDIPGTDIHVYVDTPLPAHYLMPGQLFMIPREDFKLHDIATDKEGDLTDLDYHKHSLFEAARAAGFDGMQINDFAQTDHWGNLGHYAYGLFAEAAAKIEPYAIDCVRFSHEKGLDEPLSPLSKEFNAFFAEAKKLLDYKYPRELPLTTISQHEMLAQGANGHLSKARLAYIPLAKIDGREPIPAASDKEGYWKGRPIRSPVEVQYNREDDRYYLFAGNHRVHQAEINSDTHIIAFVEPDHGSIGPSALRHATQAGLPCEDVTPPVVAPRKARQPETTPTP